MTLKQEVYMHTCQSTRTAYLDSEPSYSLVQRS